MRIAVFIALFSFFIGKPILAQSPKAATTFSTAESIFKNFEKDLHYLDDNEKKLDTLQSRFENYFTLFSKTQKDSLKLIQLNTTLHELFINFTNFNSGHITKIANRLKGIQPIRGSEISYLNRSFQIFLKYQDLYDYIANKSYKLRKKYKTNLLSATILESKLNRISFFYQNYFNSIGHTKIRRILNADDATYHKKDNEFKKIAKTLLRKKQYQSIQRDIKHLTYPNKFQVTVDTSLYWAIKTYPFKKSRIKKDRKQITHYFSSDNMYRIGQFFTQQISGAIGNFAGMFRFRKGYLYKNDSLIQKIENHLKPMDILSEKTGFALTDKMIPGHFGHIALWLGTEKQLKENKLWNHPVIKAFQNRIRLGYCILETDRGGTHLKTLKKFMNIDEIAIARIHNFDQLALEEKETIYKNALAQLGKKYDFNFDVETSDKLVCSELLYQVFGSIHWPTDSMLKRATISPDNVISLVLYQNTPLELSYYISAKSRKKLQSKNSDALAKDLGYVKQDHHFVFPQKKCERTYQKSHKRRKKKVCTTVYQDLIYE